MIWKLTNNKNWLALEDKFSWVADMQFVEQHRFHHAEGNVAIHTQMVLDELQKLPEYKLLDEQAKEILWTSALMHDVEKRSTSDDVGDGIIHAPGHAKWGERTVREILFQDIETPFHIREQITALVRLHGLPLWIMEKPNPEKKVHESSLRVSMQYIKMLSEADIKGRVCGDVETLLDNLEMFKLLCVEQDCWDEPKQFESFSARYHYFNTEDSYVNYVPFDAFKSKVILLSGLPGMGKDNYLKSLDKDIPVVSLDDIRRKHKIKPTDKSGNGRVVQEAKEEAKKYLRVGQDFVWNATNITSLMRKQLVDMFVDYGAYVKIVYIEKPYKVWRSQNRNREYPLPENVLDKMLHNLEIPQLTEAHEVEYLTD